MKWLGVWAWRKGFHVKLAWYYHVRSQPEEERLETVCRKAGAMVEMDIRSPGLMGKEGTCRAGDSRRGIRGCLAGCKEFCLTNRMKKDIYAL